MTRLYLDHNASTFMRDDVKAAMAAAMDVDGNSTSQHAEGRAAQGLIARARDHVGLAMGVCAQDVVFTSGGTESCNTTIWSAHRAGCKHLLISSMDHSATLNAVETFGVSHDLIPVDRFGRTDTAWLKHQLETWDATNGRPFISIVAANSETGVVQDIEAVTDLVSDANGLLFVDATQAFGKIPMTFQPDYMAVSAHKIGGPKGIGALYVSPDAPFTPLLSGGGQEKRRRSGTHNVAAIAGFGTASETLIDFQSANAVRDLFEAKLAEIEPELVIFGAESQRLPNTSFFAVPDASSMTLMMALDLEGISVSTGTACSSGKTGESKSIRAMGRSDEAPKGAIRVSFGINNTELDIDRFIDAWAKIRRIKRQGVAA